MTIDRRSQVFRPLIRAVLSLCAVGLVACGHDAGTGPEPAVLVRITAPVDTVNALGDTLQFVATVTDASGAPGLGTAVTWRSLDPAVASADASGRVVPLGPGLARIEAAAGAGRDTARLLVRQIAAGVRLLLGQDSVLVGDSVPVAAAVVDSNAVPIAGLEPDVTLSDGRVASLTPDDLWLRAHARGRLGLTASYEGAEATGSVTIAPQFVALAPGAMSTCGITGLGRTLCWGANVNGVLGTGSRTSPDCDGAACERVPLEVVGGYRFVQITAGEFHVCGLTADGDVYCWGRNWSGQVGGAGTHLVAPEPTRVSGLPPIWSVRAGRDYTCALDAAGVAYCWGSDAFGQLGLGHEGPDSCWDGPCSLTPQPVAGGIRFSVLAPAFERNCALDLDGVAYCWGVGEGKDGSDRVPVRAEGDLRFADLFANQTFRCGTTDADALYCWGVSYHGEFTDGQESTISWSPIAVAAGLRFSALAPGWSNVCGLSDGAIYCWGSNEEGMNGNGLTAGSELHPVEISGDLSFELLALRPASTHECAVTVEGAAYCWGDGEFGALGDGGDVPVPQLVPVHLPHQE